MLSRLFVPDTANYMIAGYLVLTVVIFTYLLSIMLRWRRMKREFQEYQD